MNLTVHMFMCVCVCVCVCVLAGLENIYHLTLRKRYELLVDMEDFEGNKVFARYSTVSLESESDGYTLHVSGFSNGGAGESGLILT